ncbi:GNAT family N-acetyltransferase [Paenibacillus piri]|uniref:N-acetyltransferase n=1 Tax=Paenibacillus piri TaxID=2547395 RepID=A0A4R5KJW8_9BACL|nr:GNAT family N-acetyltransferase [Paenibacillus piri]TDF95128.1 N-acetyltransferase [Paenibacillus piri]
MNISHIAPLPEEYLALRKAAGLNSKDDSTAKTALSNSILSVCIRNDESELIAMGRMIGDDAYVYLIADMIVHPSCQSEGLDETVMMEIMKYLDRSAPKGADVILMSDIQAMALYKKFGFELTYPNSLSMRRTI